jgi:tetratricopeptide (TPR) repeat protein
MAEIIQLRSGQYEEGISVLKECTRRAADYLWCHLWLALACMALDRETDAQAAARQVLRINPKFSADQWARKIQDPEQKEHELTLLHRAGLPSVD